MTITGNLLAKVKLYADSKYPNNEVENRIAQQSYLDGFQAAYNINCQEWLEYARMIQQDGKLIKWHQIVIAVFVGGFLRGWLI